MRKYPSHNDVEAMRRRGFDVSVLAEQIELAKRGEAFAALVEQIQRAFSGVSLVDGIGLREADGLDEYADKQTLAEYRAQDEKLDWQAIPVAWLNKYHSSLCYFDAAGMRFHLPAFLVADLRGQYDFDLIYPLALKSTPTQCALLTPDQRHTVRCYLQLAAQEKDFERNHDRIRVALTNYWAI